MLHKKSSVNYLDIIPIKNPSLVWRMGESGYIIVTLMHTSIFDRLAQRVFHRPAQSDIELDCYGSFVWSNINGQNTVYEIAQAVKDRFGADAEPLFERMILYFRILTEHKFILTDGKRL